MKLVRWTPFFEPFEEMERAMEEWQKTSSQGFVPAVDVYETKTHVVVTSPLAGVDPKDVEISVEKGVLTIKGQSNKEHEVEEKNYYRKEMRSGSFYREVALPTPVLEDKVSAEFENGMLRIIAPKAKAEPVKKVSVKIIKKNGEE